MLFHGFSAINSDVLKKTNAWDYSDQARYYEYRPNYAGRAIDELCAYVHARKAPAYSTLDVGAGTGNLTITLLDRGLQCVAIEPNKAMRDIGIERTNGMSVRWTKGTGEHTGAKPNSAHWFVMGSSFNTTDRRETLKEAHRVLKKGGYFTCMWNHRDVNNDTEQNKIQKIIQTVVPNYNPGVRREGQADVILESKLFNDVYFTEHPQKVSRTMDQYINAWRSVKNTYWDLNTSKGRTTLASIENKIIKTFGANFIFHMVYVTRAWTARVEK